MAYHDPTTRPPQEPARPPQEPGPGAYGAVAAPAQARNTPGAVALAVGIVIALIGLAQQTFSFALPYLMRSLDFPARSIGLFFLPLTVTIIVLGVIACITAAVGLRRQHAPQRAAAAGMALGATALLSAVVGMIGPRILEILL